MLLSGGMISGLADPRALAPDEPTPSASTPAVVGDIAILGAADPLALSDPDDPPDLLAGPADFIGRWRFDGDLTDAAPAGADGAFAGGAPVYEPGVAGQALRFDGSDDGLSLPVAHPGDVFTVSFWARYDTLDEKQQIRSVNDNGFIYRVGSDGSVGRVGCHLVNRSIKDNQLPAGTIAANAWQMMTLTFDGNTARFYRNGEFLAQRFHAHPPETWGGLEVSVGEFDGLLDDLRVYDRALTDAEVVSLYEEAHADAEPVLADLEPEALDHTRAQGPQPVSDTLTVSDADSPTLRRATVRFVSGYIAGADVLGFADTPEIQGSWDEATGTLRLWGEATVATWQTALRSVTYANAQGHFGSPARVVGFRIDDGTGVSAWAQRTVNLTGTSGDVNVAINAGTSVDEGGSVTLDPSDLRADVDPANPLHRNAHYTPDSLGGYYNRGAWAFITNADQWGGPDRSEANYTFGWPGDNDDVTIIGPADDHWTWDTPDGSKPADDVFHDPRALACSGMGWGLLKFDLSDLLGSGLRATSDGYVRLEIFWNHYGSQDGAEALPYDPPLPGSLSLYQIPDGVLPGAQRTDPGDWRGPDGIPDTADDYQDPGGYMEAFYTASYNSLTANGTNPWLPTPDNPAPGGLQPVSVWDGTFYEAEPDTYNVRFVLPREVINGWIEDPSSYRGLVLAATAENWYKRNFGFRTKFSLWSDYAQTPDCLEFDYAPVGDLNGDGYDDRVEYRYELTDLPDHGTLTLDGTTLQLGDVFVQDDISAGRLVYHHDGTDVRATDSFGFVLHDGAGQSSAPQRFDLAVHLINEAPSGPASQRGSILEAAQAGAEAAIVDASDPDHGDSLTFAIEGGTGAGLFDIEAGTGRVLVAEGQAVPLVEAGASYTLSIRATDGEGLSTVTTLVIDVRSHALPVIPAGQELSVFEAAPQGQALGTVTASDADPGETLTFAIAGGTGAAVFAIDALSGMVSVAAGAVPGYQSASSYGLSVCVTDSWGRSTTQTVTVQVMPAPPEDDGSSDPSDEPADDGQDGGGDPPPDPPPLDPPPDPQPAPEPDPEPQPDPPGGDGGDDGDDPQDAGPSDGSGGGTGDGLDGEGGMDGEGGLDGDGGMDDGSGGGGLDGGGSEPQGPAPAPRGEGGGGDGLSGDPSQAPTGERLEGGSDPIERGEAIEGAETIAQGNAGLQGQTGDVDVQVAGVRQSQAPSGGAASSAGRAGWAHRSARAELAPRSPGGLSERSLSARRSIHRRALAMGISSRDADRLANSVARLHESTSQGASARARAQRVAVATAGTVVFAASATYLVWAIQGGGFLAAALSSIPIWRWIDLLPILQHLPAAGGDPQRGSESDEEESKLRSLLDEPGRPRRRGRGKRG